MTSGSPSCVGIEGLEGHLILTGHVLDRLRELPTGSMHCCVTSPPYYGLRDYGLPAQVWGGDPACDHEWGNERVLSIDHSDKRRWAHAQNGRGEAAAEGKRFTRKSGEVTNGQFCQKCGAWFGHLGLEPTHHLFIEHVVGIFEEVRRVLRADGTLWVNFGDSYATGAGGVGDHPSGGKQGAAWQGLTTSPNRLPLPGLKAKDLIGMPWRIALALQDAGWYLRRDIIWAKTNPCPESAQDRPTTAHEYVFLLSKSPRYFYDREAIMEPVSGKAHPRGNGVNPKAAPPVSGWDKGAGSHGTINKRPRSKQNESFSGSVRHLVKVRNCRSVWTIPTRPYKGAHFATFPERLPRTCILAGCPAAVCPGCGDPWKSGRPSCACGAPEGVRAGDLDVIKTPRGKKAGEDPSMITGRAGMDRPRGENEGTRPITRYEQRMHALQLRASPHRAEMEAEAGPEAFKHYIRVDRSGARPLPGDLLDAWVERGWIAAVAMPQWTPPDPVGGIVLDPFLGSGTTVAVALKLGRRGVGIELNPDYVVLAERRIAGVTPALVLIEESKAVSACG